MSKNNEQPTTTKNPQVEELIGNGTLMLTAKSRKELAEMVATVRKEASGYNIAYSPVGENYATGTFCQRLDVVSKK